MWSPSVCIRGRQCVIAASSLLASVVTKQEGADTRQRSDQMLKHVVCVQSISIYKSSYTLFHIYDEAFDCDCVDLITFIVSSKMINFFRYL